MFNKRKILGAVIAAFVLSIQAPAGLKKGDKAEVRSGEITGNELVNVLWRDPTDVRSRNLFYGPGGEEAKPETVASRLIWSVGFFADEDYFLPELRVKEMPVLFNPHDTRRDRTLLMSSTA